MMQPFSERLNENNAKYKKNAIVCEPMNTVVKQDHFEFYFEGDEYFGALWDDLKAACHMIWVEIYILADDEIGRKLTSILVEKAAAGVSVNLMCDGMGSYELSHAFLQKLREAGVSVRIYHPIRLFNTRWNRRNHRKIVVIDENIAYLGGFNFHRESSREFFGERRWRDTQVRITGSLVGKILYYMRRAFGERVHFDDDDGPGFSHLNDVITNQNRYGFNHVRRFYLRYIRRARHIIRISTAYFVPDLKLIYYLLRARHRGVRVQIITSGKISDVPIIRRVNRIILRQLVLHGIEIFDFTHRMMHAKTAIFDDRIATVGSCNLNHRSLFLDLEMNLFLRENRYARLFIEQHEKDLAESSPVTLEDLNRLSFIDRILDKIFYWLRGFF